MGSTLLRLRAWWETADRTQRAVTLFGGAFLVLLLAGTFYFATRPKMALAWGGLTPADQGKIVAEIQKLGIPVDYDTSGNVRVPSDRVAEVQAMLSARGVAPTSGHPGNADLAGIGMMNPKSVEDARLNAIREGEIAKSIETLMMVQTARVLLNPGQRGSFATEDTPASASITVTPRAGFEIGPAQAKAIASMVSRAVPGLSNKNVTVIDAEGNTLFDGTTQDGAEAVFASKIEAQVNEARRIRRELQPVLDRAFGVGNTIVTARVEMDFDKSRERTVTMRTGERPINVESVTETMGGGSSVGSPSGMSANLPGGAPASASVPSTGSGYEGSQEVKRYPYDTTEIEKEKAPGTVTSLAISVLVNTRKPDAQGTGTAPAKAGETAAPAELTAEEQNRLDASVRNVVMGYLGRQGSALDASDEEQTNYTVQVTLTPFDNSSSIKADQAAAAAASQARIQQALSVLPIAALLLVGFMVVKALGKVSKSETVMIQATPGGALVPMPAAGAAPAIEAVAGGGATPHRPAAQAAEHPAIPMDVGEIQERLDVPLEQIKRMASDRPESVAMLLKSWLVEDRR